MILAHLIGEQTLPNLLAAIALRPTRVVHVASASKKFDAPIRNLERAFALVGIEPAVHRLNLPSVYPSPSETSAALATLPTGWQPDVLNLTGGTKLMSLGAHAWSELNHVPSLYVDTPAQAFTCTSAVPLPPIAPLTEVASSLSLETVLVAHGVPAEKLRGQAPTPAELAFGESAAAAWDDGQSCSAWVRTLKQEWLPIYGRAAKPVSVPANAASSLAEAAVTANWAEIDELGRFLPRFPSGTAGDQQRRSHDVADLIKNLEGGWFELHVASRLLAANRIHDLRWSVQSPDRPDLGLGENDLVGVDRRTLFPLFVSCKSSSSFEKPLEHVFALRQRATHFGGTFAQAVLCVSRLNYADEETRLRSFCKAANVRLVLGDAELDTWLNG